MITGTCGARSGYEASRDGAGDAGHEGRRTMYDRTAGMAESLALVGLVAAIGLAATIPLSLDLETVRVARLGILVGTGLSALSLVVKAWASTVRRPSVRAMMIAHGASFALRLVGVGVGAWWCVRHGVSGVAFVIGFFAVSFVQQGVEMRHELRAQREVRR